jgi:hypothetical protein
VTGGRSKNSNDGRTSAAKDPLISRPRTAEPISEESCEADYRGAGLRFREPGEVVDPALTLRQRLFEHAALRSGASLGPAIEEAGLQQFGSYAGVPHPDARANGALPDRTE